MTTAILVFKLATTFCVLLACALAHVDDKVKIQPLDAQVKFAEIKPAIQAAFREHAPRVLEGLINDASECLRDTLQKGDEELGIPPVEPLQNFDYTIDFDNFVAISKYIRGTLNLENLYVTGLTSWNFTELYDIETMYGYIIKFNLVFPALSASGAYNGKITLLDQYEVFGDGSVAGTVNDLQIDVRAGWQVTGGIELHHLEVFVTVGDINFKITGLLNDEALSQLVSEFISNELADFINDNQEIIGFRIGVFIFKLLDLIEEGEILNDSEVIQGLIKKCLPL